MISPSTRRWTWVAALCLLIHVLTGIASAGEPDGRIMRITKWVHREYGNTLSRWQVDPDGGAVAVAEGSIPTRVIDGGQTVTLGVQRLYSKTRHVVATQVRAWNWSCSGRALWFATSAGVVGVAIVTMTADDIGVSVLTTGGMGIIIDIAGASASSATLARMTEDWDGTDICSVDQKDGVFQVRCERVAESLRDVAIGADGHSTLLAEDRGELRWRQWPGGSTGRVLLRGATRFIATEGCTGQVRVLLQDESSGVLEALPITSDGAGQPIVASGACATDRNDVLLPIVAIGQADTAGDWHVVFAPRWEDDGPRPTVYRISADHMSCSFEPSE